MESLYVCLFSNGHIGRFWFYCALFGANVGCAVGELVFQQHPAFIPVFIGASILCALLILREDRRLREQAKTDPATDTEART